jgi:hypothetical protein
MAIESATRIQAIKNHIWDIAHAKRTEMNELYERKEAEHLEKNLERRTKEIHAALDGLLDQVKELKDKLCRAGAKAGFGSGIELEVPKLVDSEIKDAVQKEFERLVTVKKTAFEKTVRDAETEAIERTLLYDEAQIAEALAKLKSMEVSL